MHIIRVGRRALNLEFLVMTEELDDPARRLRVVMAEGFVFDLDDGEADAMRRETGEVMTPTRSGPGDSVANSIDAKTGSVLPRRKPKRVERA